MWWTGFGINYLSYSPSHRCELLARKKVGFFPLADQLLGKEGAGMAVQTGVSWKQKFPGKSKGSAERKQSGRQSSKYITD